MPVFGDRILRGAARGEVGAGSGRDQGERDRGGRYPGRPAGGDRRGVPLRSGLFHRFEGAQHRHAPASHRARPAAQRVRTIPRQRRNPRSCPTNHLPRRTGNLRESGAGLRAARAARRSRGICRGRVECVAATHRVYRPARFAAQPFQLVRRTRFVGNHRGACTRTGSRLLGHHRSFPGLLPGQWLRCPTPRRTALGRGCGQRVLCGRGQRVPPADGFRGGYFEGRVGFRRLDPGAPRCGGGQSACALERCAGKYASTGSGGRKPVRAHARAPHRPAPAGTGCLQTRHPGGAKSLRGDRHLDRTQCQSVSVRSRLAAVASGQGARREVRDQLRCPPLRPF